MKINKILKKIFSNQSLSIAESEFLFMKILENSLAPELVSSVLSILSFRSETFEEIFGAVKYLKKKSKKIIFEADAIDTCGTGGDNKNSFNLSTATSILCAALGLKVVKHGNRSITSKSGSIDVLEKLGIKISESSVEIKELFKKSGICFLFAPNFHPILKNIAPIRKILPFRTIFNLLGPLLNPSKIKYQLIGVTEEKFLQTHSKCLTRANQKESWVVTNKDGFDELTTTSPNLIVKVEKDKIKKKITIKPDELGFKYCKISDLKGGDSEENAFIMHRLFDGETGAIRDNVLLNTAACLKMTKKVKNFNEGIELAAKYIDNFAAKKKLEDIKNVSKKL